MHADIGVDEGEQAGARTCVSTVDVVNVVHISMDAEGDGGTRD